MGVEAKLVMTQACHFASSSHFVRNQVNRFLVHGDARSFLMVMIRVVRIS